MNAARAYYRDRSGRWDWTAAHVHTLRPGSTSICACGSEAAPLADAGGWWRIEPDDRPVTCRRCLRAIARAAEPRAGRKLFRKSTPGV